MAGTPKHVIISCNNALVTSRVWQGKLLATLKRYLLALVNIDIPLSWEVLRNQFATVVQAHSLFQFTQALAWGYFWA